MASECLNAAESFGSGEVGSSRLLDSLYNSPYATTSLAEMGGGGTRVCSDRRAGSRERNGHCGSRTRFR